MIVSFTVQERAMDPSTGRQLISPQGPQLQNSKKMYEERLRATRNKFINVPNAMFGGPVKELSMEDEEKMTLDKFKSMSPAQVQYEASGKPTVDALRSQDDARAKHYQDQNNVNIRHQEPVAPKQEMHENTPNVDPIKTPEVTGDGSIAERLALLARKEKAFSSRLLDLKAQEAAIKARETDGQFIPKQKLIEDPFSVLKDNGLTYDQLTEKLLAQNGGIQDPVILELQSQVKELREQLLEQKSSVESKEKQSYEQAVDVQRKAVTSLIESDQQFELIKATNSVEDVVQKIVDTFKKDNVLLTPMQAAQEIENLLTEEAFKLASVNKIKARLGMPSEKTKSLAEAISQQQEVREPRTLTNQMQTDALSPPKRRAANWNDWKRQTLEKLNNKQIA